MVPNPGADELLRARTLGFHTPRPGRRIAPRRTQQFDHRSAELAPVFTALHIDPDSVVRVSQRVSRRLVLMVELADGSARLLKWPDTDTEHDNDYEYVMLSLFDRLDLSARTRAALPRLLAADRQTGTIALDVMQDCVRLSDVIRDTRVVDTAYLVHLAAAMAGLHRASIEEAYAEYPDWLLRPPVPKSTIPTPYEYAHGCGIDFDVYLRTMQELKHDFLEIHAEWRPDSLIHCDLRDDNILLARDPQAPAPVRIIDWEAAGFGDPYFDLGTLVGQFLAAALRRHGDPDGPRAARHNIRTFLIAYRRLAELEHSREEQIFRYAGVLLLVQAASRLQLLGALGRIGHLCLLYGKQLIQNPTPEAILR
ncbi:phosphotransferase family protein [Nonomuraea aurantiaca]|uniref:phosphotransferase family protein n=1 Tax=Nonomuraea aurantiaca TaxID=2878562 RepID=UPI001CD93225|nr:phosphotransferase [Nonomuraea aurantiaca]MCA2227188.1 phosphotransferase [Nonomuraea aurantiaca]